MNKILYKMNISLRRLMPERMKVILRLIKLSLMPYPAYAPIIPQSLLSGCKLMSSREEMLYSLPKNAVIGEVGSLYGDLSRDILERCSPKELHLFDIDFSPLYEDVATSPVVHKHAGLSIDTLHQCGNSSFDWIYIDADHTYQGVMADIKAAMPKVKPGGYLIFNDFARITPHGFGTFGVHQAVCEFAVAENWTFEYFCLQENALYDVALRKPLQS